MRPNTIKAILATSIALALDSANARAALVADVLGPYDWSTDSANFTMLAPNGGVVGGTNDISMIWDGNAYNSSADYTGPGGASNVTLSTTTNFFSSYVEHDIQMFLPGSYAFDTALGGGNPESGILNVTVGPGQLGMHMLWDWGGNLNIDIFVVFSMNNVFGSGLLYSTQIAPGGQPRCDRQFSGSIVKNCLYDGLPYGGDGAPVKNQLWSLASVDADGDGIMGIPSASGGPFGGFSVNYNANLSAMPPASVPIPASAWLLGSGLLGMAGVIRAKKKTAAGPE